MTIHSDYEITKIDHSKKIVYLEDLNLGNKSVTNDAENVVEEVNEHYPYYHIYYCDSESKWAELIHDSGLFIGFGRINISNNT